MSPADGRIADSSAPRTLAECLEPKVPKVLVVALPDKLAQLSRWLGNGNATLRRVVRGLWLQATLLVLVSCAMVWSDGRDPGWANVSAPAFLVLIALMLRWSWYTWQELRAMAGDLDAIVTDADELAQIVGCMHRRLRWPLQLLVACMGALAGLVVGVLTAHATGAEPRDDVAFIVLDVVTLALGANVIYWIWSTVSWFGCFSRLSSIALPGVPESAPAIRGSVQLIRRVRMRLALGLACAEVPLVVVALKAHHSLLPIVASIVVMVCCVATGLAIVLLPRLFLHWVEDTDKQKRYASLDGAYQAALAAHPPDLHLVDLERYEHTAERIRMSSLSTLDTTSVWLIVATAVGPLLPSLLALIVALIASR